MSREKQWFQLTMAEQLMLGLCMLMSSWLPGFPWWKYRVAQKVGGLDVLWPCLYIQMRRFVGRPRWQGLLPLVANWQPHSRQIKVKLVEVKAVWIHYQDVAILPSISIKQAWLEPCEKCLEDQWHTKRVESRAVITPAVDQGLFFILDNCKLMDNHLYNAEVVSTKPATCSWRVPCLATRSSIGDSHWDPPLSVSC